MGFDEIAGDGEAEFGTTGISAARLFKAHEGLKQYVALFGRDAQPDTAVKCCQLAGTH
jgi:hypothetical protein